MREEKADSPLSLVEAVLSERGLRSYFKDFSTWRAWLTFFRALTGQRMRSRKDLALFRECTGLSETPKERVKEAFIVSGRRSGKSTVCALISVYFAVWGNLERYVAKGERPMIFVVAANLSQSGIIMDYVKSMFRLTPFLRSMVDKELVDSIQLKNGVTITAKPASWRTSRGFSVALLVMEELAYWRFETESATRDKEIYVAIKPGMVTFPEALVIGISTPHARQGLLYEKHERHWGKPGSILVWRSPTWKMNLTLKEQDLEEEFRQALGDSEYMAEYGAVFRQDLENYLPLEIIQRAIVPGRDELLPKIKHSYKAFADPAEGLTKGGDSFAFAIGHVEDGKIIIDVLEEWRAPFDPALVIKEIARLCELYNIREIEQDRHAVGWISKDLKAHFIDVEIAGNTKSQLYSYFSVLMNKGIVALPDSERLKKQLQGLQKTLKGGKSVSIDHYRSGKDDLSNAVAGVSFALAEDEEDFPDDWRTFMYRDSVEEETPSEKELRKRREEENESWVTTSDHFVNIVEAREAEEMREAMKNVKPKKRYGDDTGKTEPKKIPKYPDDSAELLPSKKKKE